MDRQWKKGRKDVELGPNDLNINQLIFDRSLEAIFLMTTSCIALA